MMDLNNSDIISADNFANIMGVSKATLAKWETNGKYVPRIDEKGFRYFLLSDLMHIPEIRQIVHSEWDKEAKTKPLRTFTSIELFAGGGGLALGMEKAGFKHLMLNEFDKYACATLRRNRPEWNVVEGDVANVDFSQWHDKVDFISGGFPCQAFSYAGKGGGFNDTRGTLFFQLARAVKEIQPKVFMGENVKGLAAHDGGKTLQVIKNAIADLGYTLVEPQVLKAINYMVPQKRERLILIAIRNDYADKITFKWPSPYHRVMTLRDALFAGELYDTDVPSAPYPQYPEKKKKVLEMVPMGGDWRDLPIDVQKEYMGGSFYLGGGKTGMARRLSLDEPSLTLTCSPAQKQTERCHPTETRPLTVREYARIQTFPDDWQFEGNLTAQYKQIGNAVPVNLSWAIGRALISLFNDIERIDRGEQIPKLHITYPSVPVQLELAFEPLALYICKHNKETLVGSCRQGNKAWVLENKMYNYPITKDELEQNPELLKIRKLVVIYRKKVVGCFSVKETKVVDRNWLANNGYPVKSSRHKTDTKYLLYTLGDTETTMAKIDFDDYKIIVGKGIKK